MRYILFILLLSTQVYSQGDLNRFYYFNEFISAPATTGGGRDLQTTTSTGSVTAVEAQNTVQTGLCQLTTGASASGRAALTTLASAIRLGQGEWVYRVRIDSLLALCSATESYALMFGFFDAYSQHNQVDGVFFLYDSIGTSTSSASSDKWQYVTTSANSRNYVTTTVTVSTTTYTDLMIVINPGGTSAEFFINGTSVGVQTSTIPVHASGQTGFGAMIIKSAGSTARWVWIDYLMASCRYTISR